jgi:hypothetical protein
MKAFYTHIKVNVLIDKKRSILTWIASRKKDGNVDGKAESCT